MRERATISKDLLELLRPWRIKPQAKTATNPKDEDLSNCCDVEQLKPARTATNPRTKPLYCSTVEQLDNPKDEVPRRGWLDIYALGDWPGRAKFRGKTGSKLVTRKDALKVLELAARATDKQEIEALLYAAHFTMRWPCATRSAASRAAGAP